MKKLLFVSLLILTLGFALPVYAATKLGVAGHSVVIDAGHGGTDPGSTECPTLTEAAANLDIAIRLRDLLQANDAVVYMTRTSDTTLSNADRYNYANSTGADVFLSVHLNSSTNHSTDGSEGLYGKPTKDKAFTGAVHAPQPAELVIPDLGITNFADGILLKTIMPATITESVFISNNTECAALSDGTGTKEQQIAQSLYDGLANYFNNPAPSRHK